MTAESLNYWTMPKDCGHFEIKIETTILKIRMNPKAVRKKYEVIGGEADLPLLRTFPAVPQESLQM